jgi:hypothetical protein
MGQRVLQPIVNQQVTNVLNSLEKQVNDARGGEQGVAESGESAEGPTTSTEDR